MTAGARRGSGKTATFPPAPGWVRELTHVGITGTNGKTSATRFVAAALGVLARPVVSFTTVGSFLDEAPLAVTRSYRGMLDGLGAARRAGARYAALEVTSEVLARGFARRWPFRAAVFTNLSHDHLDAHGSAEHYFASKAQLFHELPPDGVAVVNGCDEVADLLVQVVPRGVRTLCYGVPSRGTAELPLAARATSVEVSEAGTLVHAELAPELGGGAALVKTRAIGEIFGENALAAFVTALALGAARDAVLAALASATPPPGRFELVVNEPKVAIDYAHTPDALRRTLETARRLTQGKVFVVFGAGGNRDREKRPAMGAAAGAADRVIITSDNPRDEDPLEIARALSEAVPEGAAVEVELDRERAIVRAVREAGPADLVVIAGKGHETTQTVRGEQRSFSDAEIARRAALPRP